MRLVKGPRMDDRLDGEIAHHCMDERMVGNRADHGRGLPRYRIELGDPVSVTPEPWHQGLAEPTRGTCHQYAHIASGRRRLLTKWLLKFNPARAGCRPADPQYPSGRGCAGPGKRV